MSYMGWYKTSSELAKLFLSLINPPTTEYQVINVMGEAGEMGEAFRRYQGQARRPGTKEEWVEEMADIIISTYCLAELGNVDLDKAVKEKWDKIFTRGFGAQEKEQ